ncbi:MAG: type II toxin-antitoxin system RelE/ParE family toxin [Prolixibacteraceae bacterium]|jgi:phage-related protein|nr:type II toxin-antitoxin system RelE/ParE family toxin [Prolixibacteraceae bacterium]MBT6763277.1 type II toxin-antitoxin system RelE/ParE family toxin [Prolixibacteraceae bacterium]MBT7000872.1 type II toxin-antitoxin system RelE/ParE family toxin [Prolixibacteraceae bacterium]MBT7396189.1 type II toxin-antitoxin system RelE/ParE family toxin [Prolixibacteraceae bacterium]
MPGKSNYVWVIYQNLKRDYIGKHISKRFEIKYLPDAIKFLESIKTNVAEKLIYYISKTRVINDTGIFKKLKNSYIWEFRAEYNNNEYRLFAFWDKQQNTFIACTHGIKKKTQKTPKKEIEKAEQLRIKYFER